MRGRPPPRSYDEPFVWWGPRWEPPSERTIVDLIRAGMLSTRVAALLWGMLARRATVLVAAGPRGAGKTTLLTALLDFLPAGTRRIYPRGCYESFSFLDDPAVEPARSVLLINEISPHLPAYLWGPGVHRAFAATSRGFALAATAHATSIADLVGQLTGYPLRVPIRALAALSLVVFVTAGEERGEVIRRVERVWFVSGGERGGLTVDPIASTDEITLNKIPAGRGAILPNEPEIAARAEFLDSLLTLALDNDLARTRRAIAAYRYDGPRPGRP
ncbi:MAG: hypothetical protein M3509_06330 [Chloroflexota bacterium]|nr:hypothetical protein [Chloroflexota bacterium]